MTSVAPTPSAPPTGSASASAASVPSPATASTSVSSPSIPHAFPPFTPPRSTPGTSNGPANSSASSHQASDPSSSSSSQLVTPHTLALSLPHPPNADPFIDYLPYSLLLSEMGPALRHSTARAQRRRRTLLASMEEAGFDGGAAAAEGPKQDEEELESRLEGMGIVVGGNLAERLSRDRLPLSTTLDVLKFICKDFWMALWEKQVDGLRTNHRGVYVLSDSAFRPLLKLSVTPGMPNQQTSRVAKWQLAHAVGLIRGALARMGVNATVVAENVLSSSSNGSAPPPQPVKGSTEAVQDTTHAAVTFHVKTVAQIAPSGSAGPAAQTQQR